MRRIVLLAAFAFLVFPPINLPGCQGRKLIVVDEQTNVVGVSHNCRAPIIIGHRRAK